MILISRPISFPGIREIQNQFPGNSKNSQPAQIYEHILHITLKNVIATIRKEARVTNSHEPIIDLNPLA